MILSLSHNHRVQLTAIQPPSTWNYWCKHTGTGSLENLGDTEQSFDGMFCIYLSNVTHPKLASDATYLDDSHMKSKTSEQPVKLIFVSLSRCSHAMIRKLMSWAYGQSRDATVQWWTTDERRLVTAGESAWSLMTLSGALDGVVMQHLLMSVAVAAARGCSCWPAATYRTWAACRDWPAKARQPAACQRPRSAPASASALWRWPPGGAFAPFSPRNTWFCADAT